MKKTVVIFVMMCLLLVVTVSAEWVTTRTQTDVQEHVAGDQKQFPATSPDVDTLAKLGLSPFVSELPVLMIDTGGQQIFKEATIWAEVAVLDSPTGENDIMGQADTVLTATIKYRGASSYSQFDKPQYRLKFYREESGKSLDYDLFGIGADSEWVLNGPFLDRTLLRNYFVYTLASEVMDWAPGCTFFELFLDGVYQGVYLAVEPVGAGVERLDLNPFGLVSGATPYIVKRDREGTEENVLHTYGEKAGYTGQQLSVDYPGQNDLTEQQRQWIEQDISQFEEALYSDYFDDPDIGYANYIDVDSFVDYFILNEFALNHDASILSTYVYKELNGKLKLCVWDYNNAFDNYQWFTMEPDEFYMIDSYWFDWLLQDRAFVDRINLRYQELRQGSLSDTHIRQILDTGLETLGDAVDRNFSVWGYTFTTNMLSIDPGEPSRDPHSYEEALQQLTNTIEERLAFLDQHMGDLYAGCVN